MPTSSEFMSGDGGGDVGVEGGGPGAGDPIDAIDAMLRTAELAPIRPGTASAQMLAGYFDLSNALGARLHGDGEKENATFPTFAAWTTETLRIDVARPDDDGASPRSGPQGLSPGRRIYQRVADYILGGSGEIAGNLAAGEAMIYEEIGLALVALLAAIENVPRRAKWQSTWDQFNRNLAEAYENLNLRRSNRERPELIDGTMRAVLQEAVLPYFRVLAEGLADKDADGGKRRAELILLGTIRLEAYAQTRLQPVLKRNLSYVPDALAARVGSRITGRTNRSTVRLRRLYERSQGARRFADEAFAIAATRYVFTLVVGQEVLGLGRDLPVAPPANPVLRDRLPKADRDRYVLGSFFPRDLQTLREPDVWTAWQQFDRSTTEGTRTAVDDWLRYEERLNFIVNLFRSRQQVSALYGRPGSLPPPMPPRPAPLAPVLPDASPTTQQRLG
jgi:hypothetical protein